MLLRIDQIEESNDDIDTMIENTMSMPNISGHSLAKKWSPSSAIAHGCAEAHQQRPTAEPSDERGAVVHRKC